MPKWLRQTATGLLIACVVFGQSLAHAANYHYFRMHGGGGVQSDVPPPPPPAGSLFLSVTGAPAATVGTPYSAVSVAAGAVGATSFFLNSGSLAPGLVLNPSTGAIAGTPTVAGSYSAVVEVRDAANFQGLAAFGLVVTLPMVVSGSPPSVGTTGISYSAQFAASGGAAPYAFSTSSTLPPGLSLNASGALSGTPSAAGAYSGIVVQAADSGGRTASSTFSIKISDPVAISWTPADGEVGEPYVASAPVASGGQSPYLYSLNGFAPDGLTFDNSTGTFSGVPATAGSYSPGITVIDRDGRFAATGPKTIVVAPGEIVTPPETLTITGNPAAAAQQGVGYFSHFTATGGSGSGYAFSLASGALPDGLTLSSSGAISGVPTTPGTFSGIQVRLVDSNSDSALSGVFSITVSAPPPLIIAGSPPSSAQVGSTYNATFTAFEGTGTGYVFTSSGAALPPGLSISTVSGTEGLLTGVPTYVGTYAGLQIRVTDSAGNTADSSPFSITVGAPAGPAIAISGTVPSYGEVGAAYTASLAASGGTGAGYVFSIVSGALPSGLTLSPGGEISGTATTAQTYPFTVRLVDSAGDTVQASYTISVSDPLGLAGMPSPAVPGSAYSFDLATLTSGGTAPYSYGIASGALPSGMSLAADGTVSAAVVAGATETVAIQVTDAVSRTITASLTFAVDGATATAALTTPSTVRSSAAIAGTLSANLASPIWSFSQAPVSPSLGLSGSGGSFTGTAPAVAAPTTYSVTATATSGANSASSGAVALTVAPLLAISGGPVSDVVGTAGSALAATPSVSVGATAIGSVSYALIQAGSPIAFGAACPGLSFSSSNGVITGTPTAGCSLTNLTIGATDAYDGATATTSPAFAVTINNPQTAPTGTLTATGVVGNAYSGGPLATNGGTGPYDTWAVASGALPTGLTLNASTGVVSGTATAAGSYSFTIKVKDSTGVFSPASATQSIVVAAATASMALTNPTNGGVIHQGFTATGTLTSNLDNPTWTFSGISFLTPSGNTSNATFSGVGPAQSSQTLYTFTATATKGAVSVTTTSRNFYVVKPFLVAGGPSSSIAADVGSPIATTAAITYGNTNISANPTLALMQGGSPVTLSSLCPGLSFSTANGAISGAPTATCSQTGLTIQATDSDGSTASTGAFNIAVNTAQTAPTGTLTATGIGGVAYSSGPLTPHGGTSPYTWSVASGALPSGLSINSTTGVVSGTPNAACACTFTLKTTDGAGVASPASTTQTITVTRTPSNAGTFASTAQVGTAYSSGPLATSGGPGTPPYTWHLFSGTIPPGLTLNADGSLTGIPTTAGTYNNWYIYASDANGFTSATAGPAQSIVVSAATASAARTSAATVRSGQLVTGNLSTSLPSPTWTISSTPSSPALTVAPAANASSTTYSGTAPTVASSTTYTITATATQGSFAASSAASQTVIPALTISGGPSGQVFGTVGTAMTATTAPPTSGVQGTATFALIQSGGAINLSGVCPGLSFSSSTGVISGTPTTTCLANALTIRVTDSYDNNTATTSTPFTVGAGLPAVYLVVGGGAAGGGGTDGGGGGGGGVRVSSGTLVPGAYPIVIGAGAVGGASTGANGADSSFNGVTAIGGGGGATEGSAGVAGGSGGGAGGSGGQAGGSAATGQGFAGGSGTTNFPRRSGGGGGGGAPGVAGTAGSNPGGGGDGYLLGINVAYNQYYGGGGAGGQEGSSAPAGSPGLGGGGAATGATPGNGGNGVNGLGGGGAGASRGSGSSGSFLGGSGGSGTVIIRYPGSVQLATGGTVVITSGYVIHTFTSSGTFTVQ